MTRIFKNPRNANSVPMRKGGTNLPQSQHEVEEFGAAKAGLKMCRDCDSVYFKKSWHPNLGNVDISGNKDLPIKFVLCPACQMIKNKQYEGRITIKNVPEKSAVKLEELIRGFCERAFQRDPLDRLIEIKKNDSEWVVTTTENQLANKLTNKIRDSFNRVKTKTKFNKEPGDVAEITVEFMAAKVD